MKPVAEMTEAEKEQVRAWIRNWKELGPILEELRTQSLRVVDTAASIQAFDWQTIMSELRPLSELKEAPEIVTKLEWLRTET